MASVTVAAVGGPALAAPITTATQTVTFGPALTDYDGVNVASTRNFNLFDSTLGTLLSVNISTSYGFNSAITVTNSAQSASRGAVRTESAAQFNSSLAALDAVLDVLVNTVGDAVIGGDLLTPVAYDLLGTVSRYTLASGQTSSGLASNAVTATNGLNSDSTPANLAVFSRAGGGVAPLSFATLTGTLLTNTGGNTSASQETTATGTFSISYTYEAAPTVAVPEPASLALLGFGLAALGMVRRQKRA